MVTTVHLMATYTLDKPMPSVLSVREARDAYLAENGFENEEYDLDSIVVNFWGVRFRLPNPATRKIAARYHDLHHVMTGYGTDPTGEAEISAWEFRRGIKVFGLFVQMLIVGGILLGLIHSPKAVMRAWDYGKVGRPLPKPSMAHYESLMHLSLGELRDQYGLPPEGLTGARKLHLDAPTPT